MAKHTFIALMMLGFLLPAQAQIGTTTQVIEPAIMECQYDHTAVRDTLDRSHVMKDRMILRIGKMSASSIAGTPCKETPCGQTRGEERLPQKVFLKPYAHGIMKIL